MQDPKLIKTITPSFCPHCGEEIMICFSFVPPAMSWVITASEMVKNKEQLKAMLRTVVFKNKEEEKRVLTEIDSEDFVLGAEDVEDIYKSIVAEQNH